MSPTFVAATAWLEKLYRTFAKAPFNLMRNYDSKLYTVFFNYIVYIIYREITTVGTKGHFGLDVNMRKLCDNFMTNESINKIVNHQKTKYH